MNSNKTILVTGASSGIGKACAQLLYEKGHTVFGTSRKKESADTSSDNIHMVTMDVTQPDSVLEAISTIIDLEGKIDVLINCAGAGISGAIEEADETEINWQMDVNFLGSIRTIQAVLPGMRKQGKGMIINVSSIGGLIGLPFQGFYSASKFAIEGISEALEKELNPFGISVVVVQPGDIATPFTQNRVFNTKNGTASPYQSLFTKAIAIIEKDETGGLSPAKVAEKIAQIISKKRPKHKYVVAAWDQKLAVQIKKILPPAFFSWIMRDHYKVKLTD